MLDIDKINNDFAALFEQGREMLREGQEKAIDEKREQAFRQFRALGGIPGKTEDYLYTNLLPVLSKDYNVVFKYIPQDVNLHDVFQCTVPELATDPVLTVNGWYFAGNKKLDLPDGVVICSLREAALKYPEIVEKHYNRYATTAEKDGFVALNTAFAQDGVFIYIPDGVALEKPVQLVNLLRAKADLMAFQRNLIVVGRNAQATLLVCDHTLSHDSFFMNAVTEIYLDDNAHFDYCQVQNQHLNASQINSVFVSEHRDTSCDANIVTLYGGMVRNNLYVALNEEGASCNLNGLYILDKNQHVDNFSYIDHIAPRCTSNEHFKGVMDDASLANFAGCIRVRPDAQKTEAYQANNNLLLTDTARVNTKPQLIIDADDVKCSHGATVGQIDEEAMFYLRSRGISVAEAKMMMMFGFAHDIIRHIKLQPLRDKIDALVESRLRGEFSKCHHCALQCRK